MKPPIPITPTEAITKEIKTLTEQLGAAAQTLTRIAVNTAVLNESPEEKWVRTWGEAVTLVTAGKMLSCHPQTVRNMITSGKLKADPDGRVIVRDAARYVNSVALKQAKPSKYRVV